MDAETPTETVAQETERVDRTTAKPVDDQIEKLRELFPGCVTEGKVDFDRLKAALGEEFASDDAYRLTWAGKQEAFRQVQEPSTATLVVDEENSVDFEGSNHVFIEGENLEVLKALYKSYYGRVKMAYIDPPYNTGGDFIYSDDFADSLERYLEITEQTDGEGNVLTSNPETSGRFHSSWLSMMYPRLFLARQMLREDGVVFVSIDDNEVHNLRLLMNEVFGEENFVATVIWQKVFAPKPVAKYFSVDHDYVVVYAKSKENWDRNLLPRSEDANARYKNPDNDGRGPWMSDNLTARNYYSDGEYEVEGPTGKTFTPPRGSYWRVNKEKFKELDANNRIWWGEDGGNMPRLKRFLSEVQDGMVPQTLWSYDEAGHTQEAKKELLKRVEFENTENVFNTVKPPRLIRRMLQIGTEVDTEDIVMDFFAGSASTAQAVIEQNAEDGGNRRFVCVQFPEPLPEPEEELDTIADIARERLRNLRDTLDESNGQMTLGDSEGIDTGFKSFQLAESNLRQWEEPEDGSDALVEQMEAFDEGLKEDVREQDVLYELVLREGFSLNAQIDAIEAGANQIFAVTDADEGRSAEDEPAEEENESPNEQRQFYACLDDEIDFDILEHLDLGNESVFICRDSALDDALKVNLSLECILKVI